MHEFTPEVENLADEILAYSLERLKSDPPLDGPRTEADLEAAKMLRHLGRVYEVAYEMVWAKSHEHSKAAYVEMIDLIKGKQGE